MISQKIKYPPFPPPLQPRIRSLVQPPYGLLVRGWRLIRSLGFFYIKSVYNNPSKIEWDITNGPYQVSCNRAMRILRFFRGPRTVGPFVGDFLETRELRSYISLGFITSRSKACFLFGSFLVWFWGEGFHAQKKMACIDVVGRIWVDEEIPPMIHGKFGNFSKPGCHVTFCWICTPCCPLNLPCHIICHGLII